MTTALEDEVPTAACMWHTWVKRRSCSSTDLNFRVALSFLCLISNLSDLVGDYYQEVINQINSGLPTEFESQPCSRAERRSVSIATSAVAGFVGVEVDGGLETLSIGEDK
jgi:hypothetical protein